MKYAGWFLSAGLMILSGHKVVAQQCVSFTPNFSSYVTVDYDGTNIHTSVTVDGNGTMTINNGAPGCGGYIPPATHTAYANNQTGSASGTVTSSGCPDCYISTTNSQSIPAVAGVNYNLNWTTYVACSVAGTFYSAGGYGVGRLAFNSGQYHDSVVSGQSKSCYYTPACTNGVRPTCNPSGFFMKPPISSNATCPSYRLLKSAAFTFTFLGISALECAGTDYAATAPGPCS